MKQALSLFVVLMFVLSAVPIALAQDTENTVSGVTGITAVTEEAETAEETTTDEAVEATVTSAETEEVEAEVETETEEAEPILIATEETAAETTEDVEEYTAVEQVVDNVVLAFTWNEQVKLNLMAKIQAKRDAHATFLEAKGKTTQAAKFREGTTKLVSKFDGQRQKIQEKAVAREAKKQSSSDNVTALKEKVRERINEKVSDKGKVREEASSDEIETESEDETTEESSETNAGNGQKGKN